MAGIFLAKRATPTIYRASVLKDHGLLPGAFFSTSYERAQGSNAVSESTRASRDPARQGMYEGARHQSSDNDNDESTGSGVTQFVADTAEEGVRKATEMADPAKKTLDGAWQTAKDANQMVRDNVTGKENRNDVDEDGVVDNQFVDEMQNIDGPVDTVEYRNMEDNFEESKKTGDDDRAN